MTARQKTLTDLERDLRNTERSIDSYVNPIAAAEKLVARPWLSHVFREWSLYTLALAISLLVLTIVKPGMSVGDRAPVEIVVGFVLALLGIRYGLHVLAKKDAPSDLAQMSKIADSLRQSRIDLQATIEAERARLVQRAADELTVAEGLIAEAEKSGWEQEQVEALRRVLAER